MKGVAGYVVGSLVLAVLGGASLAAGLLDREVARAQHDLATLQYDESEATLDRTERYFEYASRLPWIGSLPLDDLRARRAVARYWKHQYRAVAPQEANPVAAVPRDNVDLQLIVANAVERTGETSAADRQAALRALEAGIGAYLAVLKNSARNEDAAYNFEYLVRLRDEIAKGRRRSWAANPIQNSPHGVPGAPPQSGTMGEFKLHVPLDPEERASKGRQESADQRVKRKRG